VESAFGRCLESGGRFCVGAFGRNLASVAVKKFSLLIFFIKEFYKLCTLKTICKDNAAVNCVTVRQLKHVLFPSTLTGHTALGYGGGSTKVGSFHQTFPAREKPS
jgi:hypothetical protein